MIRTRVELSYSPCVQWAYDPDGRWKTGDVVWLKDWMSARTKLDLIQRLYDNLKAPDGTMGCRDIYFYRVQEHHRGWRLQLGTLHLPAGRYNSPSDILSNLVSNL